MKDRVKTKEQLIAELAEMRQRISGLEAAETERVRAEEALRETRNYLQNLLDYANAPIIVWDPELRITQFNHAFEHLTGKSASEVLGASLDILFPEDRRAEVMARIHRTVAGEHWETVEIPILRVDGTVRIVLWNSATLYAKDGTTVIATVAQGQDITERKQAEEALQESEERLRQVVENMPVMMDAFDTDGNILVWNQECERVTGFSADEIIGNPEAAKLLFPDMAYRERMMAEWSEIGDDHLYWEWEMTCKDGGVKTVAWSNVSARISIPGWASWGVGVDVTARKRAEAERERLLIAEREQRLLAETLREVTLTITSQTSHATVLDEVLRQARRIVPHSTANIALLKDDPSTSSGHRVLRIVCWQGYGDSAWEEWAADLKQPLPDWSLDAQAIRSREPLVVPDTRQEPGWLALDETAWIKSYLSVPLCLRDRVLGLLRLDGDTPGQFSASDARRLQPLAAAAAIAIENTRLVEGLEEDVAARTAEIRAEQEKSETILRSVGDAIVMADLEMRVQYVNEAFTTLTGYTAQEVVGRQMGFLFGEPMAGQDLQSLRLALDKGQVWQQETPIWRKDGRAYDAAMTIAPVRDATGNLMGYVLSHRDVSRLKELDRARNRFITNVSHQLRTPVTTIQLCTHLMQRAELSEKNQGYLQMMEEEIAHLIHLIQDILEMATLDSGRAITAWEPVSLPTVIGDIITRYQTRAKASGLTLVAEPIPPDLPAVKGDQSRLFQALEEIVENAIIFTPSGGQVTIEARSVEEEGRRWATIAARDTGPGISVEEQEQVFDRFFRGSLAESGHVPGVGLGLSIAQEISRAHGGRVTVESQVGVGSTFTVWLPLSGRDRQD